VLPFTTVDSKYTFALRRIALLGGIEDYVVLSSRELGEALEMSQQSASKRILELLDEKLITRDLGARKQRIKLTPKGVDELKHEYSEYRRVFEINDQITLRGVISDGMGEGGYYICQVGYMMQFEEKLGFKPYEGTLNVIVDSEDLNKLDVIRNAPGEVIYGFTHDGRSFGGAIAHKSKIRNIDCAIIIPDRSHYDNIVEIVCQYHLRRTLSIGNGDRVEVKVRV
jgi:riboflavin kinase